MCPSGEEGFSTTAEPICTVFPVGVKPLPRTVIVSPTVHNYDCGKVLSMFFELDHVFVCTPRGAPEASELVRFGLREGPPNKHPGQGTANRRFVFENAMLELLWVDDEKEATAEQTRRTLLWERWSGRYKGASPFGICLRSAHALSHPTPFDGWEYRPSYLPKTLCMHIGDAGIEEPMWIYLAFLTHRHWEQYFIEHPSGIRKLTRMTLISPVSLRSKASQLAIDAQVLDVRIGTEPLLEIEFDAAKRRRSKDFRPHLPLVFNF